MAPRVSSYMQDTVYIIRPSDSLARARNLMLRRGIGRLVVIDDNERPIGILTITDLTNALLGHYYSRPLDAIPVEKAMSKNIITVEPTKSIKTAAQLMLRFKIGGLPVVDPTGRLVGIITRTDIVKAYADRFANKHTVEELMRPAFAVANRGHSIYYLSKLIHMDPAGKIIVVDKNNKPIGVITKRDLAFVTIPPAKRTSRGKDRYVKIKVIDVYRDKIVPSRIYLVPTAEDIMTPDPVTITKDKDAAEAARIMVVEEIGVLPVVDEDGSLEGVLSKREILLAVARS
ncbi:MAG: CBS domain-containing protein [Desulfurococcales archaeon]|nr:CBS domain-containing protein [Desulfurococcales archaeon]